MAHIKEEPQDLGSIAALIVLRYTACSVSEHREQPGMGCETCNRGGWDRERNAHCTGIQLVLLASIESSADERCSE